MWGNAVLSHSRVLLLLSSHTRPFSFHNRTPWSLSYILLLACKWFPLLRMSASMNPSGSSYPSPHQQPRSMRERSWYNRRFLPHHEGKSNTQRGISNIRLSQGTDTVWWGMPIQVSWYSFPNNLIPLEESYFFPDNEQHNLHFQTHSQSKWNTGKSKKRDCWKTALSSNLLNKFHYWKCNDSRVQLEPLCQLRSQGSPYTQNEAHKWVS